MTLTVRHYQPSDAKALASIFYNTIHIINKSDYSNAQLNAWAPSETKQAEYWQNRWHEKPPLVALCDNSIAGFAEFEANGHIDCFYVHHLLQGKGVGSALMNNIEKTAQEKNIQRIFAEVSITAKPFFLNKGFNLINAQTVTRRGVTFTNFLMAKKP